MNVFYEEDGGFKVGAVMADNGSSLQVEATHGSAQARVFEIRIDTGEEGQ